MGETWVRSLFVERWSDRIYQRWRDNLKLMFQDLPGWVATGATLEDMEQQIKEAITFHFDGLREESLPILDPNTLYEYVVCEAW